MDDAARLAAHRARRGVPGPRAPRKPREQPEALTTAVECYRCGAALPGRYWRDPRPRRRAGALDMAVCGACETLMSAAAEKEHGG